MARLDRHPTTARRPGLRDRPAGVEHRPASRVLAHAEALTDLGQGALPVENADLSDLLARQRVCLPRCPAVPAEHGDLAGWMTRPTPVRLVDLHRARAWPGVSWCLVDGHLRSDVELLVAKPGGCGLPDLRCLRHAADVAAVADTGQALGWSANWVRQVSRLALPVLCLAADKPFSTTATSTPSPPRSTTPCTCRIQRGSTRCGGCSRSRRRATSSVSPPGRGAGADLSRNPAELTGDIRQPAIRRGYVETDARYGRCRTTFGSRRGAASSVLESPAIAIPVWSLPTM